MCMYTCSPSPLGHTEQHSPSGTTAGHTGQQSPSGTIVPRQSTEHPKQMQVHTVMFLELNHQLSLQYHQLLYNTNNINIYPSTRVTLQIIQ